MIRAGFFNTEDVRGPRWATESASNYETPEPVDQSAGVEVEEQAHMDAAHPQIGLQLGLMRWRDGSRCFDLQNDFAIHDDIRAKSFADGHSFICYRDTHLPFEWQTSLAELVTQALLVNRLQGPLAGMPMDLDCEADNPLGQILREKHKSISVALRGSRSSSVLNPYETYKH